MGDRPILQQRANRKDWLRGLPPSDRRRIAADADEASLRQIDRQGRSYAALVSVARREDAFLIREIEIEEGLLDRK